MIVIFVTILLLLNKYIEYHCVITHFTAICFYCFFKLEVSPIPVGLTYQFECISQQPYNKKTRSEDKFKTYNRT